MARQTICPGLVLGEDIKVETSSGTRHIQLLFGDITCLTVEEKMDVVMVSAFPGDYSTVPGTMIGAMARKFDLRVGVLAHDKAEDLRKYFHCWWSKTLPEHLPYRQLLCFETPRAKMFRHPAELVSDVFRCLVAMFKNQEKTVISPMLSTGNQGFSSTRMLNAMLDAAVNWMRAGLPLKLLRIVIYTFNTEKLSREHEQLLKLFQEYKKNVEKALEKPKDVEIMYDVYLSFHDDDKDHVDKVLEHLKKEKENLRVFSRHQHLDAEAVWQREIYDTMMQCSRVVTFLSPHFLESSECVEQFNLALVCNRTMKRSLLTPFYLITITQMPTYMEMVQYIDCRDPSGSKMKTGLTTFVSLLTTEIKLKPVALHYHVFISYCHKNTPKAQAFLERLKQINPEINIFYDRIELKAGTSWQQTLYSAIDSTDVVLSLISSEYISSAVCTEEYNLALAKHLSPAHDLELVPLLIEDLPHLPYRMGNTKIIDARTDYDNIVNNVSEAVVHFIRNKEARDDAVFNTVEIPMVMDEILAKHRKDWFKSTFHVELDYLTHNTAFIASELTRKEKLQERNQNDKQTEIQKVEEAKRLNDEAKAKNAEGVVSNDLKYEDETKQFDVAFIYADHKYAYFLNLLFKYYDPTLVTNFSVESEHGMLASIENSRIVVPLLSSNLIFSSKCVDEFNVALARHRKSLKGQVLYPIQLMTLPQYPAHLHLVPCNVALQDMLWREMLGESGKFYAKKAFKVTEYSEESEKARKAVVQKLYTDLTRSDMLGLEAACLDIIDLLQKEPDDVETRNVIIHNIHAVNGETISGVSMDTEVVNTSEMLKTLDLSRSTVLKQICFPDAAEKGATSNTEEKRSYKRCHERAEIVKKKNSSTCIIA